MLYFMARKCRYKGDYDAEYTIKDIKDDRK